jgi:hypothetical protein
MSDNTRMANVPWTGRFARRGFMVSDEPLGLVPGRVFAEMACGIAAGGARRDRTDDLLLAKQALSQLSYGPAPVTAELGYPAKAGWWAWEDLNFRPHAYQARALTS